MIYSGIAISGGEPLLHQLVAEELLDLARAQNISAAVETAGYIDEAVFFNISKKVDTFLFDFKLNDEDKHLDWTGVSNRIIKGNLKRLTDIHENVVIRIPLIPGVNDTKNEFEDMLHFIKTLRKINSIHILPFHNMGSGKYDLIGEGYMLSQLPEENEERVRICAKMAESSGFRVSIGGAGFLDDKKLQKQI